MSFAKKQRKCRVLRVIQKRFVKIVRFVCSTIKVETVIVNTSKLRQYFATTAMKTEGDGEKTENDDEKTENDDEKAENNENNNMIDA